MDTPGRDFYKYQSSTVYVKHRVLQVHGRSVGTNRGSTYTRLGSYPSERRDGEKVDDEGWGFLGSEEWLRREEVPRCSITF